MKTLIQIDLIECNNALWKYKKDIKQTLNKQISYDIIHEVDACILLNILGFNATLALYPSDFHDIIKLSNS